MKSHSSGRLPICLALLVAIGCLPAYRGVASVSLPSTPEALKAREQFARYRSRVAAAEELAKGNDYAAVEKALADAAADPLFDVLPRSDQRALLSSAAWVAMQLGKYAGSRDLYLRATVADPGEPDDWYRMAIMERWLGENEAAASHLIHLATTWPYLADNIQVDQVVALVHGLDPASEKRLALLQALFDAGWTRGKAGASSEWYELALMQVQRGLMAQARATIARIVDPDELAGLQADKRFDALMEDRRPAPTVEEAALQQVERLREQTGLLPRRLRLRTELISALLTVGRDQEALELVDQLLATLASAPADEPPFEDMDESVWLVESRSTALRRLGRIDEALDELVRASRLDEGGGPNVSQMLNLGQFYCGLERPRDALATLGGVGDNISDYGRMVRASTQQCAALGTGNLAAAERALAYLRGHREDSQQVFLDALIEADRLDEAASTLVGLLGSPVDRGDTLRYLQEYREPDPLPGNVQSRARWKALLARQDVQDALARVGRIRRYDIYG